MESGETEVPAEAAPGLWAESELAARPGAGAAAG